MYIKSKKGVSMKIGLILLIISIICFVLVGLGVAVGSLNLLAFGLAFFAGSFLPL